MLEVDAPKRPTARALRDVFDAALEDIPKLTIDTRSLLGRTTDETMEEILRMRSKGPEYCSALESRKPRIFRTFSVLTHPACASLEPGEDGCGSAFLPSVSLYLSQLTNKHDIPFDFLSSDALSDRSIHAITPQIRHIIVTQLLKVSYDCNSAKYSGTSMIPES